MTPKIRYLLTDDELEAVLAHEMAHVKNRDMLTMTVGSFAVMVASIILNNALIMALFGGSRDSENGGGIIIFIAAMILTFVVYLVGTIVTMAISRYREFSADRGSAYLTRDPDALISALKKISSGVNAASPDAKRAVSGTNSFLSSRRSQASPLWSYFPPTRRWKRGSPIWKKFVQKSGILNPNIFSTGLIRSNRNICDAKHALMV